MPSKYDPFVEYLKRFHAKDERVSFTFEEIEKILGTDFPPSARRYQEWWGNNPNTVHSFSKLHLRAGWTVHNVDRKAGTVEFWRKPLTPPQIQEPDNKEVRPEIPSSQLVSEKTKLRFRSSASFGKRQEYIAVAELLRRGHDVYMTLVDDQQIDCVIRQEKDGQLRYLDIQIKARSFDAKYPGLFAAMDVRCPREHFYYIFYSESANMYWVIPSLELIEEANQNKEGKNKGKYSINFANVGGKKTNPRPCFGKYQNAFELLEWRV